MALEQARSLLTAERERVQRRLVRLAVFFSNGLTPTGASVSADQPPPPTQSVPGQKPQR